MRFNIIHERTDTVIGETDHVEVALAVMAGDEHKQFVVVDRWSGVAVDRPALATTVTIPWSTIDSLLGNRQKIMAIKLYREVTGEGLAASKDIIDARDRANNERARREGNEFDNSY